MSTLSSQLILSLLDRVSGPARGISGALSRLDGQVDRVNRSNRAAMAPMAGFGSRLLALGAGYVGVTQGVRATAGAAINFESALADVRKVVNVSDGQFDNMRRDIIALSREMPISAEGFASIYAAAAQSDIAQHELKGFAKAVAQVSTAWDVPVEQTGEALAKIKTALGRDVAGTMRLADALNHVSNVSAAGAPDLLEYTNRVSAFAETAGFSAEQALAFGGAMVGSGFEPEVAATSFRNLTKALSKGTQATKAQRGAYKQLGFDSVKVAKRMQKDAVGTTLDVLDAIKKLPEWQQISVASALFGDEARALAPIIKDSTELRRLLRETGDAATYSGSAFKEYVARANTVGNVLSILKNKVDDSFRGFGDDMLPGIKEGALGLGYVLDTLGERAGVFDKIAAGFQGFAQGLGFDGGVREAVEGLGDLLFGEVDGSGAADQLGRIFKQFEGWGNSVRSFGDAIKENPIAKFMVDISGYSVSLALSAVGVGLFATAVRSLAAALYFLSGAKAAVGILKALAKGGKWAAAAVGLGEAADAVRDGADGGKKKPKVPNSTSAPSVAPVPGGNRSNALGLSSLIGATAHIVQSLGDTPGDTFEKQVDSQRQFREGLERLLGLRSVEPAKEDPPTNRPKPEPLDWPSRWRLGQSDVRRMPGGPLYDYTPPQGIVPPADQTDRAEQRDSFFKQFMRGDLFKPVVMDWPEQEAWPPRTKSGVSDVRPMPMQRAVAEGSELVPVTSAIDRMLRGMERFAPPVALPTQAHPGKTTDDVAPLPELDLGADGLASAIDGLRSSFEAFAARTGTPAQPAAPQVAPEPAQGFPPMPAALPPLTPEVDMQPARDQVSQGVSEMLPMLNLRGGLAFDSSALDAAASKLRTIISLAQQAQRAAASLNTARLDTSGLFAETSRAG